MVIETLKETIIDNMTSLVANEWFMAFLLLVLVDYITGVGKAIVLRVLDSSVGFNGLVKHTLVILCAMAIWIFAKTYDVPYVAKTLTFAFSVNYVISLLENLVAMKIIKAKLLVAVFSKRTSKYLNELLEEEEVK
ncbi:MAG: phage holin family protein [Paracoccus sp. (in: a-proteobacteria)]